MGDDVVVAKKKRTILEKYDIPVNHLTYEYVQKCNDGKEIERIVKILRSGEEGLYPDLEKFASNRLEEIMPNSKVLRIEEPVLTKSTLGAEHWNQVNNDIANWSSEMKNKEQELKSVEDSFVTVDVPGIRSDKTAKNVADNNEIADKKKVKSIVPRDYSEWDKYDPDKEILKIELEEEKKKEELEKKQQKQERDSLRKSSFSHNLHIGGYSNTEKQFLANQEKDKGNEYFKACEYKCAIEHYSSSIAINPTPVAYNNRAMAHIKLGQYLEALRDSNKVLVLEPNNVKALHRRGTAYKHRGNFQNALEDFQRILQIEPDNRLARSLAEEMQNKLINSKGVRMHIKENFEEGMKITELSEESFIQEPCIQDNSAKINTSWPSPPDCRVKCNEFGLPKVMCYCSGVPDWVHRPPPKCLTCEDIKERRNSENIQEYPSSPKERNGFCAHTSEDSGSEANRVCEQFNKAPSTPETSVSEKENMTSPQNGTIKAVVATESPEAQCEPCISLPTNNSDNICMEEAASVNICMEEAASVSKAANCKRSAISPKIQSVHKPEARRSVPPESVKPVKVQVASKYTTKTIVKGEEETSRETSRGVQGLQGLIIEDNNAGKITTPFEFINALQEAKGDDSTLLAPVLKKIDPSNLHLLIGNKLDDIMLRSILECLRMCFIEDGPLVLKFLENLSSLQRFGIVKMFLDSKTKQVIQELFKNLLKQGCKISAQLKEAYKV